MGEMVFPGVKSAGAVTIGDHANLLDGELITIGNKVYEWDNNASVGAGHVTVTIGADAPHDIINLVAAITAFPPTVGTLSAPVVAYIDSLSSAVARIEALKAGTAGNMTFTSTMSDSDNKIDASGGLMRHGEAAGLKHEASGRYTVSAQDVTAGCIMIPTPLAAPKILSVHVFSAAGLRKAETTLWTVQGTRIRGDFDGATDPASTDIVAWVARD